MKRQSLGASAPRGRRLVVAFIVALGFANVARAQFPGYLTVKEVGEGSGTTIELRFDFGSFGADSLTSPSGETFAPGNTPIGSRPLGSLLRTFSSLDDAFGFIAGDWQGTYTTNRILGTQDSFDFQIDMVSPASVYRGGLENLSVQAGDQIRSGKTFLMSWDFPGVQASGAYLNIVPQFTSGSSQSTRFFSRPNPNGNTHSSGSSGSNDRFFASDYRNEPGTGEYRFLTKYTAAPLPLGLVMTFGATTSLNSAVDNANDNDPNPFNGPPLIGLRYIRMAEPFEVTLVGVPEPSTLAIAAIGMSAISLRRRRHRHAP